MKLGLLNKAPGFTLRRSNGVSSTQGSSSVFLGYCLDDHDGVWTGWKWDEAKFVLRTDRYGFYPTYYFKNAQGFGVSTSIVELLKSGVSRELDDSALAVFFRLGFFLGEDTPFSQIRTVPPGATLRESAGSWQIDSPGLPTLSDGKPPTRAAAITEFGVRFQTAVDQLVPEQPQPRVRPALGWSRLPPYFVCACARRQSPNVLRDATAFRAKTGRGCANRCRSCQRAGSQAFYS